MSECDTNSEQKYTFNVIAKYGEFRVGGAQITLSNEHSVLKAVSKEDGTCQFINVPGGTYKVSCCGAVIPEKFENCNVHSNCDWELDFLSNESNRISVDLNVFNDSLDKLSSRNFSISGDYVIATIKGIGPEKIKFSDENIWAHIGNNQFVASVDSFSEKPILVAKGKLGYGVIDIVKEIVRARKEPEKIEVVLKSRKTTPEDFFVWVLNQNKSIEFSDYLKFVDSVFGCNEQGVRTEGVRNLIDALGNVGVGGYGLLKTATNLFLTGCCLNPSDPKLKGYLLDGGRLPYVDRVIETALPHYKDPGEPGENFNPYNPAADNSFCPQVLSRSRVYNPCFLELIWNYWHEEGMLVQTINAVSRRFQNMRAPGDRDPLAHMEIDPLRPLNNILWGYVEEERDRLSVQRRAYEYLHQYGLELYGKAIPNLRPTDFRSKFLEAFHNLLNKCADYYRAKQDTTVDPDGYPMLHSIQELNLILAQGAHNQFGDLAWTARVEMLMQEWILARPEIRDFLQSRMMVPYKEAWMPQVDTMKTIQGWTDVGVTHFRDLGVLGEKILLTIRWYDWYDVTDEMIVKGWADLLRPHIQSYIHAYRAVTGVDLSATDGVDFTMPSVLLRKRLATQHAPR